MSASTSRRYFREGPNLTGGPQHRPEIGPELASHAIAEGLVDECQLFLAPVLVGGGTRALPAGVHAELELVDEHRFRSGVVYLHYRL